jgi:hypothetical protein
MDGRRAAIVFWTSSSSSSSPTPWTAKGKIAARYIGSGNSPGVGGRASTGIGVVDGAAT